MICTIASAIPAHIPVIAANIRQDDRNELWAVRAVMPQRALELSLECSHYARTGFADGIPAVMWGCRNMYKGVGMIWLIGTPLIEKHARVFLQQSEKEFEALRSCYDMLFNYVDARNKKAIRWLKWLGFVLDEPIPYGILGKPFHYFSWQAQAKEAAA